MSSFMVVPQRSFPKTMRIAVCDTGDCEHAQRSVAHCLTCLVAATYCTLPALCFFYSHPNIHSESQPNTPLSISRDFQDRLANWRDLSAGLPDLRYLGLMNELRLYSNDLDFGFVNILPHRQVRLWTENAKLQLGLIEHGNSWACVHSGCASEP